MNYTSPRGGQSTHAPWLSQTPQSTAADRRLCGGVRRRVSYATAPSHMYASVELAAQCPPAGPSQRTLPARREWSLVLQGRIIAPYTVHVCLVVRRREGSSID